MKRDQDMIIDSKEKLKRYFEDILVIENNFEKMYSWLAHILTEEKYNDILQELSEESEAHMNTIRNLSSKIEGIEIEERDEDLLEFEEDLKDEEILWRIHDYENLAHYYYSYLKNHIDKEFLKEILSQENIDSFFDSLDFLIKEELRHITLLKSAMRDKEKFGFMTSSP